MRFNADYHPIAGTQTPWLYTSALVGPSKFTVAVSDGESARYRVALHFAEIDDAAAGERIFDVKIQGNPVLQNFDLVKEADGAQRILVKEFRGVKADTEVTISFASKNGPSVISGIEILAEKN